MRVAQETLAAGSFLFGTTTLRRLTAAVAVSFALTYVALFAPFVIHNLFNPEEWQYGLPTWSLLTPGNALLFSINFLFDAATLVVSSYAVRKVASGKGSFCGIGWCAFDIAASVVFAVLCTATVVWLVSADGYDFIQWVDVIRSAFVESLGIPVAVHLDQRLLLKTQGLMLYGASSLLPVICYMSWMLTLLVARAVWIGWRAFEIEYLHIVTVDKFEPMKPAALTLTVLAAGLNLIAKLV
jgi:hypothetical protein